MVPEAVLAFEDHAAIGSMLILMTCTANQDHGGILAWDTDKDPWWVHELTEVIYVDIHSPYCQRAT